MNDTRSQVFVAMFSFVPYLLVSWVYTALINGGAKEFWSALGILLVVRLFFSVIETLGSVLLWRLYGKKVAVTRTVQFLRGNNFPKREYAHDDLSSYLARIEDGSEYSASVKASAKELSSALTMYESMGILASIRMHSAAETALDTYSPRSEAPAYGASTA